MKIQVAKLFTPRKLVAAVATATALLAAAPSYANEAFMLEEIVVTAHKRAESVQDVAASIAAVSSEALDNNGITSFTDAAKMVPGLNMTQNSATSTTVSLRGVVYDRESAGNEAVDVYWNGAVYSASSMFTSMFDVERLEVLRGPQGTLQGKTSPAGAILLHTKKPSLDEVEGQVKATFADDGTKLTEFGISLPVSETLAVRVAGIYNNNDGADINNVSGDQKDESNVKGGRITLAYEPSDDFSAVLTSEYVSLEATESFQVAGSGVYGDIDVSDRLAVMERPHSYENQTEITTLELNWHDVAGHALTSLTSYNAWDLSEKNDNDVTNAVAGAFTANDIEQGAYTFSQELRLDNSEGWWQYTAGIFYSKTNNHTANYLDFAPVSGTTGIYYDAFFELEDFGYFIHNRLELSDDSELQLGLRYSRVRRDATATINTDEIAAYLEGLYGFPVLPYSGTVSALDAPDGVGDAFTGGVKYVHRLTDDFMAYVSADISYRPGGDAARPDVILNSDALNFSEEDTQALEIGFKSTLLDGRVQLNGALYHQRMKDYQNFFKEILVHDNDFSAGGTFFADVVGNNDAISQGVELEAVGLITEDWRASLALSYNDFKFADGEAGYCNDGTVPTLSEFINTCDLSGQRVGDNPNWSVSASSDYTMPLETVDVFVRGLYKFNGSRQAQNISGAAGANGSYAILDVFTGVRSKDGDWEASLWAKNLLDKDAEVRKFAVETNGYREVASERERSVGASLRYNFSM